MLHRSRWAQSALVAIALAVLACGNEVATTSEGPGGGGSGGQGGVMPDLFACGVTPDCVQDLGHLGPVSDEDLRCGGELLASGQPGAVLVTSNPGPYPTYIERLYVLLGDGTLYAQSRWRCATEDACAGQYGIEWSLKELDLCDVSDAAAVLLGCDEPDGLCFWQAQGESCVPAADSWSCAELL